MSIFNDAVGAITNQLSAIWPQPTDEPQLVNGKLRPCAGTPNAVCSESTNPIVRIDPFSFTGPTEQAWALLKRIVEQNGGVVHKAEKEYLWSTYLIPVFGFVDDVEFRLSPQEGLIHVRSSSRLGFSDLGVNRGRVEQLRTAFRDALKA
ncbi:MAG: DUF1499 domain-containing protein [Chlorobium sp.]|nr:DUF1499 domain-containing protein [Chlorobium sp.]